MLGLWMPPFVVMGHGKPPTPQRFPQLQYSEVNPGDFTGAGEELLLISTGRRGGESPCSGTSATQTVPASPSGFLLFAQCVPLVFSNLAIALLDAYQDNVQNQQE